MQCSICRGGGLTIPSLVPLTLPQFFTITAFVKNTSKIHWWPSGFTTNRVLSICDLVLCYNIVYAVTSSLIWQLPSNLYSQQILEVINFVSQLIFLEMWGTTGTFYSYRVIWPWNSLSEVTRSWNYFSDINAKFKKDPPRDMQFVVSDIYSNTSIGYVYIGRTQAVSECLNSSEFSEFALFHSLRLRIEVRILFQSGVYIVEVVSVDGHVPGSLSLTSLSSAAALCCIWYNSVPCCCCCPCVL